MIEREQIEEALERIALFVDRWASDLEEVETLDLLRSHIEELERDRDARTRLDAALAESLTKDILELQQKLTEAEERASLAERHNQVLQRQVQLAEERVDRIEQENTGLREAVHGVRVLIGTSGPERAGANANCLLRRIHDLLSQALSRPNQTEEGV